MDGRRHARLMTDASAKQQQVLKHCKSCRQGSHLKGQDALDIAAELEGVVPAVRATDGDPRIGWAWMRAGYRASPSRAFRGAVGALTVADEGMPGLEAAIAGLVKDQRVRTNWREEDLWDVVLSLLAAAAHAPGSIDLRAAVRRIVKPSPVRVVAALSNVTWKANPATLGALTLSHVQREDDAVSLGVRLQLDSGAADALASHARQLLNAIGGYVVATRSTPRQGELAHVDFKRAVEDVVGLTLLLSHRLDEHGIFSLRGATNRPGIRGIALDRSALGELLVDRGAGELGALVLALTDWGANSRVRWHSADPLPLDALLDAQLQPVVEDLLEAQDAIAQRLRVAARWYARAFWADAEDDSALAVAVALDAMLTGKDALPGAVSKSRFAFLERDVTKRTARFERYEAVYQVRSAIAHGGDASRRLSEIGGARSLLADARWVAEALLDLRQLHRPENDAAFRELWAALQWGTVSWTSE